MSDEQKVEATAAVASVYVVSATCGDYYCGCGIGHLVGIALTRERAEEIKAAGESARHRYLSHGEDGELFTTFHDVFVSEMPLDVLPEPIEAR